MIHALASDLTVLFHWISRLFLWNRQIAYSFVPASVVKATKQQQQSRNKSKKFSQEQHKYYW